MNTTTETGKLLRLRLLAYIDTINAIRSGVDYISTTVDQAQAALEKLGQADRELESAAQSLDDLRKMIAVAE